MTGLRERQRVELRAHVDRVALALFAERGFDSVTVEEIAAAAGISLSTLFRHVRSKEQLLVGTTRVGRAAIVSAFAARPADEPVADALAAAILQRTERFAHEGGTMELWRRAMAAAPSRVRRASLLDDEERGRLVELVGARLGLDPTAHLEPGLRVRVALAAAEHAYEHWLLHESGRSLHELTREALAQVTPA
ncbi:TetR family transcriptional regulator [Nocardioides dongkuii]|uniref:TetR family transcriptional regulator n=1 Tax=Nocardioides dongkuii TaxID=2760089 RepID=UPI0015F802FF|nr:TetR family transcriptional regulator [Nocardioides dongkuii]